MQYKGKLFEDEPKAIAILKGENYAMEKRTNTVWF